jgi:hypothetical protein
MMKNHLDRCPTKMGSDLKLSILFFKCYEPTANLF